jgi:hypothetical protein
LRYRNRAQIALLFATALSFGACLVVRVDRDPGRTEAYFNRAYREIARLERQDPHRERRARQLCVLVYDADEGEIVRVSVPLWLVKLGLDIGLKADAASHDFDARKRYDFDWKAVKDLDRYGQGLLVSVEEDQDRVLIWLK